MTTTSIAARRRRGAPADLTSKDLLVVQLVLDAGASPAEALREVRAPALAPAVTALRAGTGLPAVAASSMPLPASASALVRALAVAEVVGAPAGPAVTAVLDALRADMRLRDLVRIRSAQAVMSARFLIGLPIVAAAGIGVLDDGARGVLLSPVGAALLILAGGLIGLATWWISRLLASISGAGSTADPLVGDGASGIGARAGTALVCGLAATVLGGPVAGGVAGAVMWLVTPPLLARARGVDPASPGPTGSQDPAGPQDRDRQVDPADCAAPTARPVEPAHPGALPTAEAVELIALALTAGTGLAEACRLAGALGPTEVRPVITDIARRLSHGATPARALPAQLAELGLLLDCAHRFGAPIAEALRLLAGDIRDRAAAAAEEAAERLAVRLVFPTTLLLVPAFGLLVVVPVVASTISGAVLGG